MGIRVAAPTHPMAAAMSELGVKAELECFELGHVGAATMTVRTRLLPLFTLVRSHNLNHTDTNSVITPLG